MWDLDKKGWVWKNWCLQTGILDSPWTPRISNQSILKEINPEHSLEGLMLKLKLLYFGHLMWRTDSLEKTLMLGKTGGRKRRGWQRAKMIGCNHWFNGREFEKAPGDGEGQGSWHAAIHWVAKSPTQLGDWTETTPTACISYQPLALYR